MGVEIISQHPLRNYKHRNWLVYICSVFFHLLFLFFPLNVNMKLYFGIALIARGLHLL